MNTHTEGGAFPTPIQELLLKAALFQNEGALKAWQQWTTKVDLEQLLDLGSYRLLPLLYHHLRQLGVDDRSLGKLKGVYLRTWCQNQILFRVGTDVLRRLHAAGIETIILKGAALTVQYYRDYGLRPMRDFDVLVSLTQRRVAMTVLEQADWKPKLRPLSKLTNAALDVRHAWGFEDGERRGFDLHWHVLMDSLNSNADDDAWADAVPIQIVDVQSRTLNHADQLLHVCVHGTNAFELSIRWVADALMILNQAHTEIDWTRLVARANKHRVSLPLHNALAYLRDTFDAGIPAETLNTLACTDVSDIQRKYYRVLTAKPTVWGGLPLYWYRCWMQLERRGKANFVRNLLAFPQYLQRVQAMDYDRLLMWAILWSIKRTSVAIRRAYL